MCGRPGVSCNLRCPVCPLSLSPRATYLLVAHLRGAGPDTGVRQQKEERRAGNWRLSWCRRGERERLTRQIKKIKKRKIEREVAKYRGTAGGEGEKRIRNEELE